MFIVAFSRPASSGRAMKLGTKAKDVDTFVDKLKMEGQSKLTNK